MRLEHYETGGLPSAPHVILDVNCVPIYAESHAEDEKYNLAGHVGVDKDRDGWSYVSRKIRSEHLYRREKGYAVSRSILTKLLGMSKPVNRLYWYEDRRHMTYEYTLRQYLDDGLRVHDAPNSDRQTVVPLKDAEHIWHDHCPIIDTRTND